jgi:hypothetical protein
MNFTCSECGQVHESWPALAFDTPVYYSELSQEDKQKISQISADFCVIKHPDRIDRFIRCILIQQVVDECQCIHYGLWVSLSEKSFNDYKENFDNDNHEAQYFGWLSNNIWGYEGTTSIPTTVVKMKGNQRPEVFPHEDFDHQFVRDYYNGITRNEAEKRIKTAIESSINHS